MSPQEGTGAGTLLYYRYRLVPPSGYEYVSPSVTSVVGYTPEEHYADPLLGYKLIHPDDALLLATLAQSPELLVRPVVLRWRRKDGTILWTEQHNAPIFDERGRWVGIEGFAFDVTRREAREGRAADAGTSRYRFWTGVRGAGAGDLLQGHIEELGQVTIVRIEGEIDLSTAQIFRAYLTRAARTDRPVVLDLSRVEYFDGSGVHVLEEYVGVFRERSLALVVVPSRMVKRILTVTGLQTGMATAESLAAAIRMITDAS